MYGDRVGVRRRIYFRCNYFYGYCFIALIGLGKVIDVIDDKSPTVIVKAKNGYPIVEKLRDFSEVNGLMLKHVNIIRCGGSETVAYVSFNFTTDKMMLVYLCEQLSSEPGINSLRLKAPRSEVKARAKNIRKIEKQREDEERKKIISALSGR